MRQSISREVHHIDIRTAVIFRYSNLQYHLSYFNMIHCVEICSVGWGQSEYNDSIKILSQLRHGHVETASKWLHITSVGKYFKSWGVRIVLVLCAHSCSDLGEERRFGLFGRKVWDKCLKSKPIPKECGREYMGQRAFKLLLLNCAKFCNLSGETKTI